MAMRNSATAASGVSPWAEHGFKSGASAIQTRSTSDQKTMTAYSFIRANLATDHILRLYREARGFGTALHPCLPAEREAAGRPFVTSVLWRPVSVVGRNSEAYSAASR